MKKKLRFAFALLFIGLILWILWANTALTVTEITIEDPAIGEGFQGFRIAQISDLHNAQFGQDNETLLSLLESARPDIIVLTGDLIDSRNTNLQVALAFASRAAAIAPTYYVTGNHEGRIAGYPALREGLLEAGVILLENAAVTLTEGDDRLTIAGVHDPMFLPEGSIASGLQAVENPAGDYTLLLAHHPEFLEAYAAWGADLVFSGHAHGGQFRLPLIGGLVAPGQGLFPRYDSGLYTLEDTQMVVSRGLGNSIIPLRINNRPEIVVVTLEIA